MTKALTFVLLLATIAASAQKKTVVYFRTAESKLLPAATATLDSLALSLKKVRKYYLAIDGYCDSNGTHQGNTVLGEDRAETVFNYLKKQGIAADNMTTMGHAESDPAAEGSDPASKAKNRRVEILCILPLPPAPHKEVQKQSAHPIASGGDSVSKVKAPLVEKHAAPPPVEVQTQPSKVDAIPSFANLKVGQKLILKNLNFVNNSAILLHESIPTIFALLKCMQDNPTLKIKLSGHVCCTPDMSLSVERAKFVYDYLVRKGIDPGRMTYEGFSNTVPLLPNDYMDSHAAKVNRRVEITIMNK